MTPTLISESSNFWIIDKPAGYISDHSNATIPSVLSWLKKEFNLPTFSTHRLDTRVSGLLLVAKNHATQVFLNNLFSHHKIEKNYLAIVQNSPQLKAGSFAFSIKKNQLINKSFINNTSDSSEDNARLNIELIASGTNYSLIKIGLISGKHHLIRAFLSSLKAPIAADLKYGAKRSDKNYSGIYLHACSLSFIDRHQLEPVKAISLPKMGELWKIFEREISELVL